MMRSAKPKMHRMSDRSYFGANPVYKPVYNKAGMIVGHNKVAKGVPFVRMKKD